MEQENKNKRARDHEDNNREKLTGSKKQNLNNYNLVIDHDHKNKDEEDDIFLQTPAVEVFDFPWLKEGMISESEDWKFEDPFSLSLEDACCCTAIVNPGIMFGECSSCQTPAAAFEILDYPEDKLEDDLVENVDSIWGSLLN